MNGRTNENFPFTCSFIDIKIFAAFILHLSGIYQRHCTLQHHIVLWPRANIGKGFFLMQTLVKVCVTLINWIFGR